MVTKNTPMVTLTAESFRKQLNAMKLAGNVIKAQHTRIKELAEQVRKLEFERLDMKSRWN